MTASSAFLDILRTRNALRKGHFVLSSGRHTDTFFEKEGLFSDPHDLIVISRELSNRFYGSAVETVLAGPDTISAVLCHLLARYLMDFCATPVLAAFTTKERGEIELKDDFASVIQRKRILIVDAVADTGSKFRRLIHLAQQKGGITSFGAVLSSRQVLSASDFGLERFETFAPSIFSSWKPSECPICQEAASIPT